MNKASIQLGVLTVLSLLGFLMLSLWVLTPNPLESARLLFVGAFGSELGLTRTLVKWIPLVLTGLGIVIAWRGGMYNIGGEGQFVVGGVSGALIAIPMLQSTLPWPVSAAIILTGSFLAGGLWGWLAGWLFVRRGVEVVISTILMNFVAIQLMEYLVSGPMRERSGKLPQTDRLPNNLALPKFNPAFDLHYGIFIGALAIVAVYAFLFYTRKGFEIRVAGENARAARANKIDAQAARLRAISLSGGLCGLAGGVEYLGLTQQIGQGFDQNWGFLAIPVALLAGLHPLVVAVSALYFAAILGGSKNLAGFTANGTVLIYVVQAAGVLGLIAIQNFLSRGKRVSSANV